MDAILLKTNIDNWKKYCEELDGYSNDLFQEEQDAIDYLKDFWRSHKYISDTDISTISDKCEELRLKEKAHSGKREIATCIKNFRGLAKKMYTKDNFAEFKKALEATMPKPSRPTGGTYTPRPTRTTTFTPQPQLKPQPQQQPQQQPQPQPQPQSQPSSTPKKESGFGGCLVWLIIIGAIYWGYNKCTSSNWNMLGSSNKTEVSGPIRYVLVETLNLRSSSEKNPHNIIGKLHYGTSVAMDADDASGNWVQIITNGQTGYVSSSGIVDETDFQSLNNIWGDDATRRMVAELRYRQALIAITKTTVFNDGYKLYGLENHGNNIWYSNTLGENGVFAVILDNKTEGKRLTAIYSFDKLDNPTCQFTEFVNGETMYINEVTYKRKQYKIDYGTYKTNETIGESQVEETVDNDEQDFGSPSDGLFGSLPNGTSVYEGVMSGYPIRFTITKDEGLGKLNAIYKNINYGGTIMLSGESLPAQSGDITFYGTLKEKQWSFHLTGTRAHITGTAYGENKQFEISLTPQ